MTLYIWVAVLLIFTAIFLGDALRRLRAQIVVNDNMEIAQQTMRLHVFVMFFHTSMFTICNTTLVTSLFFPDGSTPAIWNLTKILMFLAQSISQLIIMFLIEKLSKPMVLKKEVTATKFESELTETADDWNRSTLSSDFDIICYLRRQSQTSLTMQKSAKLDAIADSNPLGESQKSVDLYDLKNSFNNKANVDDETENPIITEDFSDEDALMASERLKHASKKHNNSSIN